MSNDNGQALKEYILIRDQIYAMQRKLDSLESKVSDLIKEIEENETE